MDHVTPTGMPVIRAVSLVLAHVPSLVRLGSKPLRVLREVGLVRVREAGQQRLYGLDARGLQPVHEWVIGFEQYWNENFDRLNEYVKKLQQKEHADDKRS